MKQKTIVEEHKLKIIKIIDDAPKVKTFRVEIPSTISFYPGQFFMVRFADDEKLKRAYSIASSPTDGYMDITMDLVGEFTTKLFACKTEDYLMFKGPYGKFYFNDEIRNKLVLVGGGLGITPLRSIIRYCNEKKLSNKINLIYSVRTPDAIVYREELEEVENPNYNYVFTVTRPTSETKWDGRAGRIDKDLLKENIMENGLYFLCGPLEFVKNIVSMLESLGVSKEQIKTDIWGA